MQIDLKNIINILIDEKVEGNATPLEMEFITNLVMGALQAVTEYDKDISPINQLRLASTLYDALAMWFMESVSMPQQRMEEELIKHRLVLLKVLNAKPTGGIIGFGKPEMDFEDAIAKIRQDAVEECLGHVDDYIKKQPRLFPRYDGDTIVNDILNEDFREDLRNEVINKMTDKK